MWNEVKVSTSRQHRLLAHTTGSLICPVSPVWWGSSAVRYLPRLGHETAKIPPPLAYPWGIYISKGTVPVPPTYRTLPSSGLDALSPTFLFKTDSHHPFFSCHVYGCAARLGLSLPIPSKHLGAQKKSLISLSKASDLILWYLLDLYRRSPLPLSLVSPDIHRRWLEYHLG